MKKGSGADEDSAAPVTVEEAREVVAELERRLAPNINALEFDIDSREPVITVIDGETGKEILRFPPDEIRRVRERNGRVRGLADRPSRLRQLMEPISSRGPLFSFSGLASGLDTQGIINALIQVEQIPLIRLENQKVRLNQTSTLLSNIESKLKDLRTAARDLDTASEFLRFNTTSGDEDIVTLSASGGAQAGTHTIDVDALAQAGSDQSQGLAGRRRTSAPAR